MPTGRPPRFRSASDFSGDAFGLQSEAVVTPTRATRVGFYADVGVGYSYESSGDTVGIVEARPAADRLVNSDRNQKMGLRRC